MRRALLIAIVLLTACAHTDQWTTDDTVVQGILIAVVIADGIQTSRIQDHPNIMETGPVASLFLGNNPSTTNTWLYMASLSVSQFLIARWLPHGWRRLYQVGSIWRHGLVVNEGHQIGLWATPCTRNQDEHPC